MRFVTKKTIDRYLEKVPDIKGGWKPFQPRQAIPVMPRIPVLNPDGPTYVLYGETEAELTKRKPSIDYFYLIRRAVKDPKYI